MSGGFCSHKLICCMIGRACDVMGRIGSSALK